MGCSRWMPEPSEVTEAYRFLVDAGLLWQMALPGEPLLGLTKLVLELQPMAPWLRLGRWKKILGGSTSCVQLGGACKLGLETSALHGFSGAEVTPKHIGYNDQMSLTGGEVSLCYLHAELSLAEPSVAGSSLAQGMGSWRLQRISSHTQTLLLHC